MNLLSNALKFTAEGHVAVRVQRRFDEGGRERLLYSVSDSGIGISAQAQKTLFESFSQADSSTTRRYGGSGLGLAISRELVQMMGGRIEVSSEPGKGTRFSVDLPLSPALDAGEADELAQLLQHRPALLASEDNLTLDCLQALLERWGLRVERCLQPRRLNAYRRTSAHRPCWSWRRPGRGRRRSGWTPSMRNWSKASASSCYARRSTARTCRRTKACACWPWPSRWR